MTVSRKRVLVVEDELLIALHLKDILTEIGFDADLAENVADGLQLVENHDFDIALLDVNVEGASSFEIADTLIGKNVPVVFITGYRPEGLNARYENATIVEKPFDPDELANKVRALTS